VRAALVVSLALSVGCNAAPPSKEQPALNSMPPVAPVAKPDVPPGMYCEESCPMKVRYALADVTSVYELGFDLANEAIFVSYDATLGPAKEVTRPMIAAIKTAGFDPWLAKEEWPADAQVQVVAR
jgi:hypothetical protein